jgi:putative ABC transport system permease protein
MKFLAYLLSPLRLIYQSAVLAIGQIWANKLRAFLTTIGIIIGVASVTAVIAALTGLRTKILADFETIGANKIYIGPYWPDTGPKKNASYWTIRLRPEQFDGLLEQCPSVGAFTRIARMWQKVTYRDQVVDEIAIQAVEPSWHKIENRAIQDGRPLSLVDNEQARPVCVINPGLRDKLRLGRDCIGDSIQIGSDRYEVIGVLEPAPQVAMIGRNGADMELYIPFNTAWRRYSIFNINAVAASRSPTVSEDASAELRYFLRKTRRLAPDEPDTFRIQVIEQFIQQFNRIAVAVTMVAAGIVGISLLVGGVGIMNIMLVSVSERTREIGLRKAVGARPAAIMLQFLVEAVVICLFGGLIGVLAGHGLTMGIAAIPNSQLDKAYVPAWAIALSFGFAASVGLIFGMFPAIKASRLDPIEALRHE